MKIKIDGCSHLVLMLTSCGGIRLCGNSEKQTGKADGASLMKETLLSAEQQ